MNRIITLIIAVTALLSISQLNAQNCDTYEIKLNKFVKEKNYDQGYSILNEALTACPSQKVNMYNFGETILENKIKSAADDASKKKYAAELGQLIDKRIANFKDGKEAFWKGEKINYLLKYGVYDRSQAYAAYKELFGEKAGSKDGIQKLSANTVLTYYSTALELMNEEKISFEEVLEVYFQTKKVAEGNIELRSIEYGTLAEELDSLQQISPTKKLTPAKQQTMANAQAAKDVFVEVNESMEAVLEQYTTCDNVAPMFVNKFEANKDSIEWLTEAYTSLASKECYEAPIMKQIEDQYAVVWKRENPQAVSAGGNKPKGGAPSSCFGEGARMYKKGNYSGAIAKFKCAMNEVSGTKKGDVAYYMALSYQKTGSLTNAVSWAKKAASYKKGWGAPYQLIAGIFGSNANSCGSNTFQKLSAYWVAADYANKACSVDSRSCSWSRKAAASYNGTAPTQEMIFNKGLKKGDRVSVSCFGGATTRVR